MCNNNIPMPSVCLTVQNHMAVMMELVIYSSQCMGFSTVKTDHWITQVIITANEQALGSATIMMYHSTWSVSSFHHECALMRVILKEICITAIWALPFGDSAVWKRYCDLSLHHLQVQNCMDLYGKSGKEFPYHLYDK